MMFTAQHSKVPHRRHAWPRDIAVVALPFCLLLASGAAAQVVTSSYTGNGTGARLIGAGFQPDVVIVKDTASDHGVIRTSTMPSGSSKLMDGTTALVTNRITSFAPLGFIVGSDSDANGNAKIYHWVAFKQEAGKMKVGSYTGNGGATQAITGLGFQPDLVFILPAIDKEAIFRSSLNSQAYNFDNSSGDANWVPSLDADGFTVGTDDRVNKSGATYHYVAWKRVVGEFELGTYLGDGIDNRQITAVGFEPEYAYIKVDYGFEAVQRMASIDNSTDESLFFKNASSVADRIQEFISNGFEIGKDDDVNKSGKTYLWFAWKKRPPTAVRLISFSAARIPEGATLLSWRTGHEIDNLGFHVYRQDGTRRVRLTSAPVAGSGLTVGAGTALAAGHEYRYWDLDVEAVATTYWLEDLDFSGRSTVHGPFTAAQGAAPTGADARSISALLTDLRSASGQQAPAASRPWLPSTFAPQASSGSADELQQVIAGKPGAKIGVNTEGWYRVTRAALEAAGLPAAADASLLQLYADGIEQSIIVTGSPWDGVEFYGRPAETPYSDTRTYWLIVGSSPGSRIQALDGTGSGTPAAPSFQTIVERRDRAIYFAALHNGDVENWFGPLVNGDGTSQELTVVGHAGGDGELTVSLQGVTTGIAHAVRVTVNGVLVGSVTFEDQQAGVGTFTVPGSALVPGTNTVVLTALGGDNDMGVVDTVSLSYPRNYVAEAEALWLSAVAGSRVTVTGFAGGARVLDLTDPNAPVFVLGSAEVGGMSFTVGGSGERRLLALGDPAVSAPAWLKANAPSRLTASRNLTWIIMGPSDLLAAVTPLVDHRRAQGYRVEAVDVEDIYDEFSFGQKSPAAIKRFLARASAPGVATTAVVLLGDATVDPRNYVGGGAGDRVPAAFVPTTLLETASDDWYVDFDGNDVPEAAIGRLPARTPAQAAAMADKIVAYDSTPAAAWTKQLMFVAGANDTAADFDAMSTPLGVLVPSGYSVESVSASSQGVAAAKSAVLSGFNAGRLIVNYLGHGSVELWANDLLTRGDVGGMANAAQLPFVVAMNCLNGYFQGYVQEESLAEALLRAPGGAVAVWGSSTLTPPHAQAGVNAELLRWLFSGVDPTLGQAIVLTKSAVGSSELRRGWIFFGDPATKLKGLPQTVVPITPTEIPGVGPVPPGGGSMVEPPGGTITGAPAWPVQSLADFTGDGRADLLLTDAQSGRWQIAVAGAQDALGPAGHWPLGWSVRAIELTGDRSSDVFVADERTGRWMLGLNDGRGFFRYTSGYWAPGYAMRVGDFDGDAREDILLYSAASGKWFQALSDGAGGFVYRRGRWSPDWSPVVSNLNGDGLADVVLYNPTTGQYFTGLNDGAGDFTYQNGHWAVGLSVVPLDLDGDFRDDLFLYSKATGDWWTGLSDGLGAFNLGAGRWAPGWELAAADFNADGIDDLLVYDPQGGRWMTVLDGVVGQQLYAGGQWLPGLAVSLGDINGDGRADLFLHHPQTGAWSLQLSLVTGRFDEASGVLPAAWAVVGRPR